MVPEAITFANLMSKGAIFKKKKMCQKAIFNSFVMMQFSKFEQLFFLAKKNDVVLCSII